MSIFTFEIYGKRMKKQAQHSTKENPLASAFGLEGNPFINWITHYGENLLYAVLGLFILLFGGYLWFAGNSTQAEGEFQNANEQFIIFQQEAQPASKAQIEAFSKLTQLIAKQPDLGSKYDARIAQELIDRQDYKQAKPFAEAALDRVSKDQIPFYVDYAQITLLIAGHHFEEAIKQSIALKEEILKALSQWNETAKEHSSSELLFAFNMLRIPLLQQQIGAKVDERQSWDEWKSYSNSESHSLPSTFDTKAFNTVAQLFTDGSVSLNNYIDMRMQMISSLQ